MGGRIHTVCAIGRLDAGAGPDPAIGVDGAGGIPTGGFGIIKLKSIIERGLRPLLPSVEIRGNLFPESDEIR